VPVASRVRYAEEVMVAVLTMPHTRALFGSRLDAIPRARR
jgi:hypothetical protein